jgi:hypothetical protein
VNLQHNRIEQLSDVLVSTRDMAPGNEGVRGHCAVRCRKTLGETGSRATSRANELTGHHYFAQRCLIIAA